MKTNKIRKYYSANMYCYIGKRIRRNTELNDIKSQSTLKHYRNKNSTIFSRAKK